MMRLEVSKTPNARIIFIIFRKVTDVVNALCVYVLNAPFLFLLEIDHHTKHLGSEIEIQNRI